MRWAEEGATRLFVLAPVATVEPRSRAWAGFEVSSGALTTWLSEFSAAEPLLPRTLAAVAVVATVRAPDGRVIFHSPNANTSLAPLAKLDLRGTPAITGLEGYTVEIAIDPDAAANLIIG